MLNATIDLPAMLAGYLECALWASTADDGEPLDAGHFPTDIADESQAAAREACESFVLAASAKGIALEALPLDSSAIGHDLWLSRNHHGAGFWDRGLGDVGQHLSDEAHAMGSSDAYVGDDGRVYLT